MPVFVQVYGFGGVSCVIDASGGIVRAHIGGHWGPHRLGGPPERS